MRMRLGEADQQKYPEGDKWFEFDLDALLDLPSGELEKLEAAMDYTIMEIVGDVRRQSTKAIRASMWIARRLGGVTEKFADFQPLVLRMEIEAGEDGEGGEAALPPASPPEPAPK